MLSSLAVWAIKTQVILQSNSFAGGEYTIKQSHVTQAQMFTDEACYKVFAGFPSLEVVAGD